MSAMKSFTAGFAGVIVAAGFLVATGVQPTAVAPTTASVVSFTASGDFNSTTQTSAVLNDIKTIGPDLHLALGDLSYVTTPEQNWCDYVTARVGAGFPFELVSGNHESDGANGSINNFSACLPNQLPGAVGTYGRQYYVDVPQQTPLVRFIQISPALQFPDGAWSYAAGTPRYAWTSAAIDSARASGIPWIVIGMHKPCLSVGQYSCEIGADLLSLLVDKRVDLVLSGHEHLYARSKQLATGGACSAIVPGSFTAACVADGDNALRKGAGTVFGIVGTGGTPLRDVSASDTEAAYFAATSGLNASPTWGSMQVTADATQLSARFAPAAGAGFTDAFTITAGGPPPNAPPTAAFTASCTDLSCSADGSTSTDSDGTVTGYAWSFGDGDTAVGATTTHSYAASGSYQVTLTVTDDDGSTGSVTRTVSVTTPGGPTVYAADTFTRSVAVGFGTAETGGSWTTTGTSSYYSVSGGSGRILHSAAGRTLNAYLTGATSTTTDLSFSISPDKRPTVGDMTILAFGRRIVGVGAYKARITARPNGDVAMALVRESPAGTDAIVASTLTVPGLTYVGGDALLVRLQVTGTSPTTVQAKVWKSGTTEPAGWVRSVTDATPSLQTAGSTGVSTYLSGSSTSAPVVFRIDDVIVRAP
ncbi:PKD domain-containing protein [Leifsonia sp. YIM 134122]|uniref:PKD domain-containing protein n=1 Tax=Leifsonia stereocauli TaxID=3134136 RepID=A0ABU9W369_9MICO